MAAPVLSSIAKRLEGKVALITGGASGIGRRTAELFRRHGARVVIADVQDDKGIDMGASYVHCDVTSEPDVQRAVDTAVQLHGGLDIMFNNAGIVGSAGVSILEATTADFQQVMAVNVLGCFLGTKHAARVMVPARRGSIVNTASIASVVGGITPTAYTASKHAVLGLTRNAAAELGAFGVRVNCVSPHALVTPLAEEAFGAKGAELEELVERSANLKGVGLRAADIAEAVAYLASDESRYVSGANLVIDGGVSVARFLK